MSPELEDELLIRRVLERYMRFNDDRALDRILALFWDDAVYRVAGDEFVGLAAIRAFLSSNGFRDGQRPWTAPGALMSMPASMHVSSCPVIDVDGDQARAESDFIVLDRDPDGHVDVFLVGRYRDVLRRHPQRGWLLAERTGVSMRRRTVAG